MKDFNHILIFKTNIKTTADKLMIEKVLGKHEHIERWNVDLHDIDCVLRIESHKLQQNEIIALINHYGYDCHELI
jgi:hypothetical protein